VLTSEELRVAALNASAKRGKWVARRRVFRRWLAWIAWSYLLPVVGLVTIVSVLVGFAFWQYMGHEVAYAKAQKWVQQEFGNVISSNSTPAASGLEDTNMIPPTKESTPILQIDREMNIKTSKSPP
jgi:cytoskeletal protein RodZ